MLEILWAREVSGRMFSETEWSGKVSLRPEEGIIHTRNLIYPNNHLTCPYDLSMHPNQNSWFSPPKSLPPLGFRISINGTIMLSFTETKNLQSSLTFLSHTPLSSDVNVTSLSHPPLAILFLKSIIVTGTALFFSLSLITTGHYIIHLLLFLVYFLFH